MALSGLVWVNLAVILGYAAMLLISLDSTTPRKALSVARDWLPLAFTELAYQEMGWFTLAHRGHTLEHAWVIWDRSILRGGLKAAVETLGPALPSVLEIAYSLTYALAPFSIVVLYIFNCRARVDRFQFVFVLAVALCCMQFPFWPSTPPRLLFPGEDFPAYYTVFRRFNWWLLGDWGIQTSVFPSAHVAGAFSAAFGMWRAMPEPKWVTRISARDGRVDCACHDLRPVSLRGRRRRRLCHGRLSSCGRSPHHSWGRPCGRIVNRWTLKRRCTSATRIIFRCAIT